MSILEFEKPEERHLIEEIYAVGYKDLEIGSEDQNAYIVSSTDDFRSLKEKYEFRPTSVSRVHLR